MKALISITLLITVNVCFAETLVDQAKTTFSLAKCLLKKTSTMCAFEEVLNTVPSEPIEKDSIISPQSNRYNVIAPDSDWIKLWPDTKTNTDLELMHKTGHAYIIVGWYEGEVNTYEKRAREPLIPFIEKFDVEPEIVDLEVWPYDEAGVFYAICYNTNKKTQECIFSAAASIPNGVVHFDVMTDSHEKLVEAAIAIVASVDVPNDR